MLMVEKREGNRVPFDLTKIERAIEKAFDSTHVQYSSQIVEVLALRVSAGIQEDIQNGTVGVETIQDCVETTLSLAGYSAAAKAYILYRKQRENIRALKKKANEYAEIVTSYISQQDEKVQDEHPRNYSVGGLILSNSGAMTSHYWLNTVYDGEIAAAHNEGWMHIHNLDMMSASSAGWDILQLASLGFGLPGQIQSRPPKHLDTLLAQLVNLVGTLQNEWSSAQSLSHFDTCLAPFVKKDNLTDSQIRSALETFVFGLNTPSRWGTQPPFANVVFDWNVPEDWKEKEAVIGDFSIPYGQCQAEMHRIQQQFFEIFLKGDVQGRGFPYPIPVIRTGKNPDFGKGPYADALFACAAKYGSPQFSRLDSMMEGYFSYKAGRGNIGAVTLNLPKIAYASQSEEQFFQLLDHYAKLAFRSLDTKRKVLDRLMEGGLFPYTKAYMHDFHACYGSLGIVGLNEALVNASFLDDAPTSAQAQAFCLRMLHHLRQLTEAEPLCNFQASPAEGVSQRLAKLDRQAHPDIVTAGTPNQPYYTNGVHLAADATADVFEALSLETDRLACFDGGSLFSLWMKDALEDGGQARHLTESILKTFDIDVFCLTPVYTICPEHGWHAGEGKCPKCGQEGQTWVRVSGYYRPLESCNQAKQQEFKDRIFYTV